MDSMSQRRKRSRSDSFPTIESVSSEVQPITMKIIVHLDNNDNLSLQSNNSSIDYHGSSKMIGIFFILKSVSV